MKLLGICSTLAVLLLLAISISFSIFAISLQHDTESIIEISTNLEKSHQTLIDFTKPVSLEEPVPTEQELKKRAELGLSKGVELLTRLQQKSDQLQQEATLREHKVFNVGAIIIIAVVVGVFFLGFLLQAKICLPFFELTRILQKTWTSTDKKLLTNPYELATGVQVLNRQNERLRVYLIKINTELRSPLLALKLAEKTITTTNKSSSKLALGRASLIINNKLCQLENISDSLSDMMFAEMHNPEIREYSLQEIVQRVLADRQSEANEAKQIIFYSDSTPNVYCDRLCVKKILEGFLREMIQVDPENFEIQIFITHKLPWVELEVRNSSLTYPGYTMEEIESSLPFQSINRLAFIQKGFSLIVPTENQKIAFRIFLPTSQHIG